LSSPPQGGSPAPSSLPAEPSAEPWISPAAALYSAFDDTLRLLLQPFDAWRWIKFSAVCVLLGGGTSSAAFNWSLGALPAEANMREVLDRARQVLSEHFGFIMLAAGFGLALAVTLFYLRATFRFVLVDSILRGDVQLVNAWGRVQPQARSYFLWLLGVSVGIVTLFSISAVFARLSLRSLTGHRVTPFAAPLVSAGFLVAVVLIGLLFALLVVLTDDLVVPLMFAEGIPLSQAWGKLGRMMHDEARSFTVYLVLRLVVSVLVGMIVLFILYPVLVGFFSGVVIVGALLILTLHLFGILWVWNPATIVVAAIGLLFLTGGLLIVLGMVGMPAQVFLQTFGMRFMASREHALDTMWAQSWLRGRQE
jgi:hypothetical protein